MNFFPFNVFCNQPDEEDAQEGEDGEEPSKPESEFNANAALEGLSQIDAAINDEIVSQPDSQIIVESALQSDWLQHPFVWFCIGYDF